MNEILSKLPIDKLSISENMGAIPLEKFMGFLTVGVEEVKHCRGYDLGWRMYKGENDLIIRSGIAYIGDAQVELLHSIKYKKELRVPYNDFVTPFQMLDILTPEGVSFFMDYYKPELEEILQQAEKELIKAVRRQAEIIGTLKYLENLT